MYLEMWKRDIPTHIQHRLKEMLLSYALLIIIVLPRTCVEADGSCKE